MTSRTARRNLIAALLVAAASGFDFSPVAAAEGKVQVFILAGQSNMEGKAQNKLYDSQAAAPATAHLFAHLMDGNEWGVRDDVFIKFLNRHGRLTLGYGSPGRTGVELEFGTVMGEALNEPVLLVKAAWGGHSLVKDFRSPSAGLPDGEILNAELERARNKVQQNNERNVRTDPLPTMDDIRAGYGASYRRMLAEVRETMTNYETLFPKLAGWELELAGFVWFQGWNDQYNGAEQQYETNLKHFIRDVRSDLGAPDLPFVIGVMGQNGSQPAKGAMLAIQQAQLAMNGVPEFEGNVRAIRTDELVDQRAEQLFSTWQENFAEWEKIGSDRPYHYLGSAIWMNRIGRAMAETMLDLMGNQGGGG